MPEQNDWTPQKNYIETQSLVEGVRVWRPKPPDTKSKDVLTFNCPNCGAPTQYDLITSGLSCQFCGFKSKIITRLVGKQAKELEFRKDLVSGSFGAWQIDRKHQFCENCGAELDIETNDLIHNLSFLYIK